jgi:hypothetical protein
LNARPPARSRAANIGTLRARGIPFLRRNFGLVFQDHKLLFDRNAFENVMLPLDITGFDRRESARRARAALDKVGLLHKEKARPITLSGGEQQRLCIARAIVHRPAVLLADEPTGNLDANTPPKSARCSRLQSGRHRRAGHPASQLRRLNPGSSSSAAGGSHEAWASAHRRPASAPLHVLRRALANLLKSRSSHCLAPLGLCGGQSAVARDFTPQPEISIFLVDACRRRATSNPSQIAPGCGLPRVPRAQALEQRNVGACADVAAGSPNPLPMPLSLLPARDALRWNALAPEFAAWPRSPKRMSIRTGATATAGGRRYAVRCWRGPGAGAGGVTFNTIRLQITQRDEIEVAT